MMPLAPALFSTTTGWPMERESWSAEKRASVSVTPPGGHGTTSLIGLLGYCARSGSDTASAAASSVRFRRPAFIEPPREFASVS
jgi:hypothetical protein